MTMAPFTQDENAIRQSFRKIKALKEENETLKTKVEFLAYSLVLRDPFRTKTLQEWIKEADKEIKNGWKLSDCKIPRRRKDKNSNETDDTVGVVKLEDVNSELGINYGNN